MSFSKGLFITLVLCQLVRADVNFTSVPFPTLLMDILFYALTTHILGAILADQGTLRSQIILSVILLSVFNCFDRLLFPHLHPTAYTIIKESVLSVFLGLVLIYTALIFI